MCEAEGGMGYTCVCNCRCLWGPEEEVKFPGTAIGTFVQPDKSAGNLTEAL